MKNMLCNCLCKAIFIAGAVLVVGCNDAKLQPIDNAAYIAEAYSATSTILNVSDYESVSTTLTARLGDKATSELSFYFEISPEVLTNYNEANGTSYVQMPETSYELSAETVTISIDEVSASPVQVTVSPYTDDMKLSKLTYAIPVKLYSSDGGIMVMEDNSEFLIICNRSDVAPVPIFNYEYATSGDRTKLNRIVFDMGEEDLTFTAYTFEFMMYVNEFATENNLMLVALTGSTGGLTNRMWVRFELQGDETLNRYMQLRSISGSAQYATTANQAKTWEHVAITYDGTATRLYLNGSLVAEMSAANSSITFRYFSLLPQPSYFVGTGDASIISFREVRFWNVTRTVAQLTNNMNSVDPTSEGLLGYWRMDEGEGYTFEDATGNGNTGTCYYSDAGDLWDSTEYGPATGLQWVDDYSVMVW